jgi:hypothetical protein
MKRFLILIALLLAPLAPAQAYWEYGHETVAKIAQANMSAKARANIQRLLRAAPMLGTPKCAMRNIGDVSVWADCIKGDRVRWGYTNSWHYQNVDICKPFDLKSACAEGNCVSAQIDRNFALLSNKALPAHVRLEALAFRGSGPLKSTFAASKWQRYRSKMSASGSHSACKGILFRDRSHFGVLRI